MRLDGREDVTSRHRAALSARPAPLEEATRSYLQPDQVAALLSAAEKLDAEAPEGDTRRRRPLLATLALAGLRISEALDLRWRDVNLGARRLRVAASKTDAGVREVDLTPALQELLTEYRDRSPFSKPGDLVFPTNAGNETTPPTSATAISTRRRKSFWRRSASSLSLWLPPLGDCSCWSTRGTTSRCRSDPPRRDPPTRQQLWGQRCLRNPARTRCPHGLRGGLRSGRYGGRAVAKRALRLGGVPCWRCRHESGAATAVAVARIGRDLFRHWALGAAPGTLAAPCRCSTALVGSPRACRRRALPCAGTDCYLRRSRTSSQWTASAFSDHYQHPRGVYPCPRRGESTRRTPE